MEDGVVSASPLSMPNRTAYNEKRTSNPRNPMPLSGEAIRLMNYIDDVAVTLRRVLATVPTLSAEERARVAEHLRNASPNADDVAKALAAESTPEEIAKVLAKPASVA
jgi:hypothetical protein